MRQLSFRSGPVLLFRRMRSRATLLLLFVLSANRAAFLLGGSACVFLLQELAAVNMSARNRHCPWEPWGWVKGNCSHSVSRLDTVPQKCCAVSN